jgi:RND family efflux transporter MFP subunit
MRLQMNVTNMSLLRSITCTLACLAGLQASAAPLGCLIEPERVAEVGSPVIGVIESIHVERGSYVRKGQVLAMLRADVERASVGVASARAQADADVRGAAANFEFMRQKQARAEELVQKNFISKQALEQARVETSLAEQKLGQSREQQKVWARELELAHAQLSLRSIRAPFDGIIADRYVWAGERVEDKALFRVAKVDPLRVEIVVPVAKFGTVQAGTLVSVTPDLPNAGVLRAKVVLVDKLMDAASNTFRVRAELANADAALPSGLRCKAELDEPAKPVVSAAPRAGPAPAAPLNEPAKGSSQAPTTSRANQNDGQKISGNPGAAPSATTASLESVRWTQPQATAALSAQQ